MHENYYFIIVTHNYLFILFMWGSLWSFINLSDLGRFNFILTTCVLIEGLFLHLSQFNIFLNNNLFIKEENKKKNKLTVINK